MIWLKRRLNNSPALEAALQNRFDVLFVANGSPPEMLLIAQEHEPLVSTLWIRLDDERYRTAFPEFEEGSPADLPKRAVMLIGHKAEFEKLFEYGIDGDQND